MLFYDAQEAFNEALLLEEAEKNYAAAGNFVRAAECRKLKLLALIEAAALEKKQISDPVQ